MADPRWSEVDAYASDLFDLLDDQLTAVVSRSEAADLPSIQVSEAQGRFLEILVRGCGARRVLEVGTLGGFSTTFLARGVSPHGVVVSLELDPQHVAVARENFAENGLETLVEIQEGDAHESLRRMIAEGVTPFDLVFLDAEKSGYPDYLRSILKLSRPGTILIADNVVRGGDVVDSSSEDPNVLGVREFNALVAATPEIHATVLQTVGAKGYDGLLIGVVG